MLAKIKYTFIVADTFLNMCEKIHRFLSSIKRDAYKRKLVLFSASRCIFIFNDSRHSNYLKSDGVMFANFLGW